MSKVIMIAGLAFGDEGKGTITDYLTRREKAHMVVRYNGGAQAAHNVVLPDGRHHTFSQFGSGTFHGAKTHLSRFMVVNPAALIREGKQLSDLHVSNPFDNLTVEEDALLTTPYQIGANRLREILRKSDKHGSCGMGVGETVSDFITYGKSVPLVQDLLGTTLEDKLNFIRDTKLKEFLDCDIDSKSIQAKQAFSYLTMPVKTVLQLWEDAGPRIRVVYKEWLQEQLTGNSTIIFEGAQGVLLDQTWGFQPYTTWTDITFNNALELIKDTGAEVKRIGVIRTYLTRHGAGPFPTESDQIKIQDEHNKEHPWQGALRKGNFDMVLLRYALDAIKGVDKIAITHMDKLPELSSMCIAYDKTQDRLKYHMRSPTQIETHNRQPNWKDQHSLADALLYSKFYTKNWPINEDFLDIVEGLSKSKVSILSYGPMYTDKIVH